MARSTAVHSKKGSNHNKSFRWSEQENKYFAAVHRQGINDLVSALLVIYVYSNLQAILCLGEVSKDG